MCNCTSLCHWYIYWGIFMQESARIGRLHAFHLILRSSSKVPGCHHSANIVQELKAPKGPKLNSGAPWSNWYWMVLTGRSSCLFPCWARVCFHIFSNSLGNFQDSYWFVLTMVFFVLLCRRLVGALWLANRCWFWFDGVKALVYIRDHFLIKPLSPNFMAKLSWCVCLGEAGISFNKSVWLHVPCYHPPPTTKFNIDVDSLRCKFFHSKVLG